MKKENKRFNKGFSLLEMLIVIAVIAILSSVVILSAAKYERSLKGIEMDGIAEELFVVAQNNLSSVYGQGYLGADGFGAYLKDSDGEAKENGIYYLLHTSGDEVGAEGGVQLSEAESASTMSMLSMLLPNASLDSTVKEGYSYIIRYQKDSGLVLGVFVSESPDMKFGHNFSADEFDKLFNNTDNKDYTNNAESRRKYGEGGKAVIGYCGSGGNGRQKNASNAFVAPTLGVNNGTKLTVTLKLPDYSKVLEDNQSVDVYFDVTGDKSGNTQRLYIGSIGTNGKLVQDPATRYIGGSERIKYDDATNTVTIILDDVQDKNLKFSNQYCSSNDSSKDLIPGEDLTVMSQVVLKDGDANELKKADSNKGRVNSLFGDSETVTVKDPNDPSKTIKEQKVDIDNPRHLENLDPRVNGFDPAKNGADRVVAEQDSDIDASTLNGVKYKDGNTEKVSDKFLPIEPTYPLEYDGGGHKISNLEVEVDGPGEGGGLFGDVTSELDVRDLFIVDPDISAQDGNAGALAATISNPLSSVEGVLAYNTDGSSSNEIYGGWSAGGLIGQTAACDHVTDSGAALYVRANGNAGGLIGLDGSNDGSTGLATLSHSYAGGHTYAARYMSGFTGEGRVNTVSQGQTSSTTGAPSGIFGTGGLIGRATAATDIDYCYTTASAGTQSAGVYSGGFIGSCDGAVTVDNSYSVGRVVGADRNKSGAFSGVTSGTLTGANNYYLTNISMNLRAADSKDDAVVQGISGKATGAEQKLVLSSGTRTQADPYDIKLTTEYSNKYYFRTIDQLDPTHTSVNGITNIHTGDWQIPSVSTTSAYFENDEKLIFAVDKTALGGLNSFVLSVTGEASRETSYFKVTLTESPASAVIYRMTLDSTQKLVAATDPDAGFALTYDGSRVTVVFDDISAAGNSFCELFGTGFIPGENITARISAGTNADPLDLANETGVTTNSLFAYIEDADDASSKLSGISGGVLKAYLSNIRHLQNLEKSVSDVTAAYTINAELLSDIAFENTFRVYKNGANTANNGFISINNAHISVFEGNMRTLEGFVFADNSGTGLFAKLYAGASVSRVQLVDCTASGSGFAGMLAGAVDTGFAATVIDSVLVANSSKDVMVESTSNSAGGLIGYAGGTGTLTVNNCGATVAVKAVNAGAAAGGLIGRSECAGLTVANSYAGGHTSGAAYETDVNKYNVTGAAYAGGLIGYSGSGALNITSSFSAASAYGQSGVAGGIVGELCGAGYFDPVYAAGPAAGANVSNRAVGAFIGHVNGGSFTVYIQDTAGSVTDDEFVAKAAADGASYYLFYMPEIYSGEISAVGRVSNGTVICKKVVKNGNTVITESVNATDANYGILSAYYDEDATKIGSNNKVSAKAAGSSYKIKSVAYDATLIAKQYEFPFIVWTELYRETDEATAPQQGISTYYGDWRPVNVEEQKTAEIDFRTLDPVDNSVDTPTGAGQIYLRGSLKISVPAIGTLYADTTPALIYLCSADPAAAENGIVAADGTVNTAKATLIGSAAASYDSAKGQIAIDSALESSIMSNAGGKAYVLITFTNNNTQTRTVTFNFDTSFRNDYTGSSFRSVVVSVKDGTALNAIKLPEYFVGGQNMLAGVEWYKADSYSTATFNTSNRVDFTSADKLTGNLKVWAKYTGSGSGESAKRVVTVSCVESTNNITLKTVQYLISTAAQSVNIPLSGLENYELIKIGDEAAASTVKTIAVPAGTANLLYTVTFKSKSGTGGNVTPGYQNEPVSYSVVYHFANTGSDGNYKKISGENGFENCYTKTYSGFQDIHGTAVTLLKTSSTDTNGVSFNAHFSAQQSSADANTRALFECFYLYQTASVTLDKSRVIDGETDTYNVVHIYLKRTEYELSFENTGIFVSPVFVEAGAKLSPAISEDTPLYNLINDSKFGSASGYKRSGYNDFNYTSNASWKLTYKTGTTEHKDEAVTDTTVMPCANTVATAQWTPLETTKYTVLYHYENADNSDYSVLGSETGEGRTGDAVNGETISKTTNKAYKAYTGTENIHTHSYTCYSGAVDYVIGKNGNEYRAKVSYGAVYTVKVEIDSGAKSDGNYSNGYIATFKYTGSITECNNATGYYGYDNTTYNGTHKFIYIDGYWYAYTGSNAAGSTINCTYWNNFQLNAEKTTEANSTTKIEGDGSTVVNIYFSRKLYTLTFNLPSSSHTHTDECYKYTNNDKHVHDSTCARTLTCQIVPHNESCYTTTVTKSATGVTLTFDSKPSSYLSYVTKTDGTVACVTGYDYYNYSSTTYTYYFCYNNNWFLLGTGNYHTVPKLGISWPSSTQYAYNDYVEYFVLDSDQYVIETSGTAHTEHDISCYLNDGDEATGIDISNDMPSIIYSLYVKNWNNGKTNGRITRCKGSDNKYYYYYYNNNKWYYLKSSDSTTEYFSDGWSDPDSYNRSYRNNGNSTTKLSDYIGNVSTETASSGNDGWKKAFKNNSWIFNSSTYKVNGMLIYIKDGNQSYYFVYFNGSWYHIKSSYSASDMSKIGNDSNKKYKQLKASSGSSSTAISISGNDITDAAANKIAFYYLNYEASAVKSNANIFRVTYNGKYYYFIWYNGWKYICEGSQTEYGNDLSCVSGSSYYNSDSIYYKTASCNKGSSATYKYYNKVTNRALTCDNKLHDDSHSHVDSCYEYHCNNLPLNSGGTKTSELICGYNTNGTTYKITAKFDQTIEDLFPSQYNCKWKDASGSHYANDITILVNMPGFDCTFNYVNENGWISLIHYYREVLDEDVITQGSEHYYKTVSTSTKFVDISNIYTYNSDKDRGKYVRIEAESGKVKYFELSETVENKNAWNNIGDFATVTGYDRYAFRDGNLECMLRLNGEASHYAWEVASYQSYSKWMEAWRTADYSCRFCNYYYEFGSENAKTISRYTAISNSNFCSYKANGTTIYGDNDFYYTRKTADIIFISYTKNSDNTTSEEILYQKTLQYGASLDKYVPTAYANGAWSVSSGTLPAGFASPTNIPTGKYFEGWYLDSDLTIKYTPGMTMPDGEVRLYAKYVATPTTVTFEPGTGITFNGKTINTYSDRNVKSEMYNASDDYTTLKTEYIPVDPTDTKTFAYWYYLKDGTETPFAPSTVIETDIVLKPRWQDELDAKTVTVQFLDSTTKTPVRSEIVYSVYTTENSSKVASTAADGTQIKVGDLIEISAPATVAYNGTNYNCITQSPWVCTVQQNSAANVIVFYYSEAGADVKWTYTTEYWVRYRSTVGTYDAMNEGNGILASGESFADTKEFMISSATSAQFGESGYDTYVQYTMPSGYGKYKLDSVTYNGNELAMGSTGTGIYFDTDDNRVQNFTYWVNGSNTLRFYLTVDDSTSNIDGALTLSNGDSPTGSQHHTYNAHEFVIEYNNGNKSAKVDSNGFITVKVDSPAGFAVPAGADSVSLTYTYRYFKYDGEQYQPATQLVHAGTYGVNVYVVLNVNYTEGGASKTADYLIWQSTDKSVKLVIDPLKLKLTSASGVFPYNNKNKYTLDDKSKNITWEFDYAGITAERKNELQQVLANDEDNISVNFTVDAFRMDVGTSYNSFIVSFANDYTAKDYQISTSFGTLCVYWNASADFAARYGTKTFADRLGIAAQSLEKDAEINGTAVGGTDDGFVISIPVAKLSDYNTGVYRVLYEYTVNGTLQSFTLGTVQELISAADADGNYKFTVAPETAKSYAPSDAGVYPETEVHVYLELDPTQLAYKFGVENQTITYGQKPKSFAATNTQDISTPEGFTVTISTAIGKCTNEAGQAVTIRSDELLNAGRYFVSLNTYVTVKNGTETVDTQSFTGTDAKTAELTVTKKKVTLTPDAFTVTIGADGKLPVDSMGYFTQKSNITVTWGDNIAVADSEGVPVALIKASSVKFLPGDDFNIGRCSASFVYELADGQDENNYDITVNSANRLTVKWTVKVTTYLRLSSVTGITTDLPFETSSADFLLGTENVSFDGMTEYLNPADYVSGLALTATEFSYNGATSAISGSDNIRVFVIKKSLYDYGSAELEIYYELNSSITDGFTVNGLEQKYDGTALTPGFANTYGSAIAAVFAKISGATYAVRNEFVFEDDAHTDVGDYEFINFVFIDVTSGGSVKKFLVKAENGTFTVKQREIIITSNDASLEVSTSSGTVTGDRTYTVTGNTIVGTDVLDVQFTPYTECGENGELFNKFTWSFTSGNSSNYSVTSEFGKLTVITVD